MTEPDCPAFYIDNAGEVADASDLIARFGQGAAGEAAARADRSLDIGNHVHFCRWRQIERLIPILSATCAIGTLH